MYNIAIVDDEREILEVLNNFLNRNPQLNVTVYENAVSALSQIQNGRFDLVLLDIMMPGMNGLEFLEKLKQNNKDIKVIMMTAYDSLDKMITAHKFAAENYLTKPFESLKEVEYKIMEELGK